MLSGNGTIDYSVEAHTLDAQETSAARQESTTRNIHGSITKNFHWEVCCRVYYYRSHQNICGAQLYNVHLTHSVLISAFSSTALMHKNVVPEILCICLRDQNRFFLVLQLQEYIKYHNNTNYYINLYQCWLSYWSYVNVIFLNTKMLKKKVLYCTRLAEGNYKVQTQKPSALFRVVPKM